jgi:hypothetical protein
MKKEGLAVTSINKYIYVNVLVQLRPLFPRKEAPDSYADFLDAMVCRNKASLPVH